MKAFVFPGQGAQFVGMGKDLYEKHPSAKKLFEKANDILGFRITDIMFEGTDEELKQTKVTQPAVFLHSVISALCLGEEFKPDMVAGHSLGELSALVAAGCLDFEDGLAYLVKTDILRGIMYFSYEKGSLANIYPLDASEVREIIKMNRNGVRPESLKTEPEPEIPEFITAVGDDSITRFDTPKRKKNRSGRGGGKGQQQRQGGRNNGRGRQKNGGARQPGKDGEA